MVVRTRACTVETKHACRTAAQLGITCCSSSLDNGIKKIFVLLATDNQASNRRTQTAVVASTKKEKKKKKKDHGKATYRNGCVCTPLIL